MEQSERSIGEEKGSREGVTEGDWEVTCGILTGSGVQTCERK